MKSFGETALLKESLLQLAKLLVQEIIETFAAQPDRAASGVAVIVRNRPSIINAIRRAIFLAGRGKRR